MGLFHIIERPGGAFVILRTKSGVFKQAYVYQRDGFLYAEYNGGFVGLLESGNTTCPHVKWRELVGVTWDKGTSANNFLLEYRS